MTSRGPLTLAALASAAVPGLDPDTVEGVLPSGPGDPVEVAFVSDREHRRWVIRCPKTPAASAHLERSAALLALLARRLTMPVPSVKGWVALPEGGRAAVHAYLTGRLVTLAGIEPGSTLATGLGRTIAQLHNLDTRVYEEAGVPVYDAASYRSRRLAELDRAAATGRVPTGLLSRWERVLDDESLWAFTTTATHGAIGEDSVLATPDDGTGTDVDVKTLLGWENAQVADPADDLAPLVAALAPETFDSVLEAYAHARVERPDRHLHERARVIGEMQLVRAMMIAVAAGDDVGAEESATQLRRLDDRLAREDEAAQKAASPAADQASSSTPADTGTQPTSPEQESESTSSQEPTSTVDTQPVRTAPVPTSGTGGAAAPTEDAATGSAPAETPSEDPADAVQVEHPATPTPVTAAPATGASADSSDPPESADAAAGDAPSDPEGATADASEPATSTDDLSDSADPSVDASDSTTDPDGTEPTATGSAEDADSPSQPNRGSDAITAEVTPIDDDDGDDDVVPIRPR